MSYLSTRTDKLRRGKCNNDDNAISVKQKLDGESQHKSALLQIPNGVGRDSFSNAANIKIRWSTMCRVYEEVLCQICM